MVIYLSELFNKDNINLISHYSQKKIAEDQVGDSLSEVLTEKEILQIIVKLNTSLRYMKAQV